MFLEELKKPRISKNCLRKLHIISRKCIESEGKLVILKNNRKNKCPDIKCVIEAPKMRLLGGLSGTAKLVFTGGHRRYRIADFIKKKRCPHKYKIPNCRPGYEPKPLGKDARGCDRPYRCDPIKTTKTITPPPHRRCPQYSPPSPGWCPSPNIKIAQPKDTRGCFRPPICRAPQKKPIKKCPVFALPHCPPSGKIISTGISASGCPKPSKCVMPKDSEPSKCLKTPFYTCKTGQSSYPIKDDKGCIIANRCYWPKKDIRVVLPTGETGIPPAPLEEGPEETVTTASMISPKILKFIALGVVTTLVLKRKKKK